MPTKHTVSEHTSFIAPHTDSVLAFEQPPVEQLAPELTVATVSMRDYSVTRASVTTAADALFRLLRDFPVAQ